MPDILIHCTHIRILYIELVNTGFQCMKGPDDINKCCYKLNVYIPSKFIH